MRSVPTGSFERLTTVQALWAAWCRCRRGKRYRSSIARYDFDADRHLCRLSRDLRNGTYRPGRHRLSVVHDPKTRLVAAPPIDDRVVHNALLGEIAPTYERGFIDHSYAVCTGRGVHRAVLYFLKWTRRTRFRLALDIRRYFPSVRHKILAQLYARRLRDERTLDLVRRLITEGGEVYRTRLAIATLGLDRDPIPPGCGLPLGGYFSHWSGGLYLDALDHFVKRTLGIAGYLRYMDDIILFHDAATRLEDAHAAVANWLARERDLTLNPRRGRVEPTSQPATFLGYRISRAGVRAGPKARRRLRQKLRHATSMDPDQLARCLASYRGVFLSL